MKKLLILFPLLVFGFQMLAVTSLPPLPRAKSNIKWETRAIDLSSDMYGNQKCATFYFTNTGKTPLKIASVKFPGYWGPVYSKDSIMPGKKGYIELTVLTSDTGKGFGICHVTFSNGETDSLIVFWQKLPSNSKWKTSFIKLNHYNPQFSNNHRYIFFPPDNIVLTIRDNIENVPNIAVNVYL